jgi:dTDP-4-dehydrorhamnose 3,5-epimerase
MINDIKIVDIKDNRDTRGFFREIFKLNNNKYFSNMQISHSFVKKNIIKGFHGHLNQYQFNYIIRGSLSVLLKDNRKNSKSYGENYKFNISNKNPISYMFPPGVLHAYKTISPIDIVYITSDVYKPLQEIKLKINSKYLKILNN